MKLLIFFLVLVLWLQSMDTSHSMGFAKRLLRREKIQFIECKWITLVGAIEHANQHLHHNITCTKDDTIESNWLFAPKLKKNDKGRLPRRGASRKLTHALSSESFQWRIREDLLIQQQKTKKMKLKKNATSDFDST